MSLQIILLIFAVLSLSQAGNLIRLCDTQPVTIAFYRLLIAFFLMSPFAVPGGRITLRHIKKRTLLTIAVMSVAFTSHFFFWIMAVQKTKVANAAICFSLSPVFTAIGAHFFLKERLHSRLVLAIVTGIAGVAFVSKGDFSLSPDYLLGDMLSLLAGFMFSIHCLLGRTLRQNVDSTFLMTLVYGFGILISLFAIKATGAPLTGFSATTKLGFVLLALFPTILGHASLIYSMKFFEAATVSILLLLEPVFAGIVAYLAFGEALSIWSFLGYLCIVVGLFPLVMQQGQKAVKKSRSG